jgi:secreted trypsin-like serine protease
MDRTIEDPSEIIPPKNIGPRIISGSEASLGQLPWQAALYLSNGTHSWFCGGSIISNVWILTAGQCVEGAATGTALTGVVNTSDQSSANEIYDMIVHEGFNSSTLENNIALIALSRPLKFDGINLFNKCVDIKIIMFFCRQHQSCNSGNRIYWS